MSSEENVPSQHAPQFHILSFFRDEDDNCALTAVQNNVRFHVIAEIEKLDHAIIGGEYVELLEHLKRQEDGAEASSVTTDSGVDVTNGKQEFTQTDEDAETALQSWMLQPLGSIIDEYASASANEGQQTLKKWYTGPVYYFNLEVENDSLQAIELEPDDELKQRVDELLPQISIPKYVRDIDVPIFCAEDLLVLDCSHSPPPYHPSRVQVNGTDEVFFLKLVDNSQPQPTKRELSLLNRIAQRGLHKHIRCPKLEGLVIWDNDHSKIMGFLQTDIPDPTPLTLKLDATVPQELRDRWAAESERMKNVLHEHNIVWGDAKADNFMVDKNDDLWIIDFGGSYTEGWVDAGIKETAKGDDMGVEKIANALHDPVANTWDPDTAKSFGGSQRASEQLNFNKKRKAEDSEEHQARKRHRSGEGAAEEDVYCVCETVGSGRMIACDEETCEGAWFHFECVGLTAPPPEDQPWYCPECRIA
ncbi:hypothetical protein BAUCODRAFT_305789 [Baudoinia panamericana UAMH 10762]|uniref:PHD-type domain-containing protein n=1 Tax=Baudoinia panamericana (strain UAMH 10762) TaxID=717646 RepID=M2MKF8_BAUPA|nr:uncharacterized protein BAUCODRAFT_305789 [Baudoinia panamericana UAMH 10762]EMC91813.1 hypothetical protein BAUCODRAFT_305789 [Baudoinia panamericana UAMH 10762]